MQEINLKVPSNMKELINYLEKKYKKNFRCEKSAFDTVLFIDDVYLFRIKPENEISKDKFKIKHNITIFTDGKNCGYSFYYDGVKIVGKFNTKQLYFILLGLENNIKYRKGE